MSTAGDVDSSRGRTAALRRALADASSEVLPLRATEETVVAHVPTDVPFPVRVPEGRGREPPLYLAARSAGHGFDAAPHIAARLVRDRWHLHDLVARLHAAGVTSVFVIAGDAA